MKRRFGMVIDLDRCTGCGACTVACAVENNTPPTPAGHGAKTGTALLRVYRAQAGAFPETRTTYFPVMCMHCGEDTPCEHVCPQTAVDVDAETGLVSQIPVRCLGCRYCMAACPYHARVFNWWDPVWPEGAQPPLNPDVSPRMRGVAEKCSFCHGRMQAAREKAAAEGERDYRWTPACVEACPTRAMVFGDLDDPEDEVHRLAKSQRAFQLLPELGTGPKVHYLTSRDWVRKLGGSVLDNENRHG